MDEQREKLLRWLVAELGSKKDLTAEDNANYLELQRILKLAPLNLTYGLGKFRDETYDEDPFTPICVDYGQGPRAITGWRVVNLDGGEFGPDENAIVLETD